MATLFRSTPMLSALTPLSLRCCRTLPPLPASAVPASDMRSGRVDQSAFIGLTTVPLFVAPSGSRFGLTDLQWTPGKYSTPPAGPLTDPVAVWIQDGSSNVKWYMGLPAGSATPHLGWSTGLVFEPNTVVTLGVSTSGAPSPGPARGRVTSRPSP